MNYTSENAGINALIKTATEAVASYRANPVSALTGGPNVEARVRAEALVEAVSVATEGAVTMEDFLYTLDENQIILLRGTGLADAVIAARLGLPVEKVRSVK